jgi:hypothetical protein
MDESRTEIGIYSVLGNKERERDIVRNVKPKIRVKVREREK